MFDGGHGKFEESYDSLWDSYEVVCLMEDVQDKLDRKTFEERLNKCYCHAQGLAQRHMKNIMMAEINGEEPRELSVRGILNNRDGEPFLWFKMIPQPGGNIDIYIIKGQPKETDDGR